MHHKELSVQKVPLKTTRQQEILRADAIWQKVEAIAAI